MKTEVAERTGLHPLVTDPTRGGKILDMPMVSRPGLCNVKVITPVINNDHKAIVATAYRISLTSTKRVTKLAFENGLPTTTPAYCDIREDQFVGISDAQNAWDMFYNDAGDRLGHYYPLRVITVTSKDPDYITPESKHLLRIKNRLIRRGKIEKASSIARQVFKAIHKVTSTAIRGADSADPLGRGPKTCGTR